MFLTQNTIFEFYVYAWYGEDGQPYYCGKGKGVRAWKKTKNHVPPADKNRIKVIAKSLTEFEAFILERRLIELFGRIDLGTGHLINKTNGGQGVSGRKMTDEAKRKLGDSVRRRLSSPEQKRILSDRAKAQWADDEKRRNLITGLNSRKLNCSYLVSP